MSCAAGAQPPGGSVAHTPCYPAPLHAQQITDISLEDYIAVKPKYAVYVPHTAGRYQKRRFRKAQCPIVERWVPKTASGCGVGGGDRAGGAGECVCRRRRLLRSDPKEARRASAAAVCSGA